MAAAVLNATEGYLWRSIRGNGLAYGASVEVDAESGLVEYSVYRVSPTERRESLLMDRAQTLWKPIKLQASSCGAWQMAV